MERIGLRAAGRLAGCSHAHIKRLADAGQLYRGDDGLFDPADVLRTKAQADPGLVRKPLPKGGDSVVTSPAKSPPRRRSPPRPVTTLPPADDAALWAVLAYLVDLIPWAVAEHGGGLQIAFDTWSDVMLDLPAELNRRGFGAPSIELEPVDWDALAEAHGIASISPHAMAADYARRRAEDRPAMVEHPTSARRSSPQGALACWRR